ncbi:MAG: phosphotransferase, partial [Saccharothrix sp.]|nr:phosphotransferase [Saccharothrix sp.]
FDAWLARSPAGRRWAVGVHNDVRPANLVVTPFDTKLVDLELFGDGDAAADLGKLLVCTPWPGAAGDAVAHAVQERFRDELPHAADGLREDAEGLYRGAYAADAVMGTLNQRIAGLEELLAADPSGRAAEAQLRAVAADIQGVTGPMLETFGLAPFGAERLVSSLGQWVLYDHPEAPRRRPTAAVRRDAGPGSSASPKLIAATSHGLGPVTDGVNPTPMTPRMTAALDAGPTVSPYASATDKRLDLSRGKALDRSLTNS